MRCSYYNLKAGRKLQLVVFCQNDKNINKNNIRYLKTDSCNFFNNLASYSKQY